MLLIVEPQNIILVNLHEVGNGCRTHRTASHSEGTHMADGSANSDTIPDLDDQKIDLELIKADFQFVETDDQRLRCFIFENMADPQIMGNILVSNLEHIYQWIKTGAYDPDVHNTKPSKSTRSIRAGA